jgi:hypothetical protein
MNVPYSCVWKSQLAQAVDVIQSRSKPEIILQGQQHQLVIHLDPSVQRALVDLGIGLHDDVTTCSSACLLSLWFSAGSFVCYGYNEDAEFRQSEEYRIFRFRPSAYRITSEH